MSFNVRDSNILVGPLSGVELPNGAGASTVVAHQVVEPAGLFGITAAGATGNYCIWVSPQNPSASTGAVPLGAQYKVVGVQYVYDTASSSGTIAVENCAAGTATGSGVNVLSAATASTSVASTNTPAYAALNSNVDNLLIAPNGRINVKFGGTATGLVNLCVQVYIARVS